MRDQCYYRRMTTFSAQTTITINAPASKVWEVLTNPELIGQYLHDTKTISDWQVDSPITWKGEWKGQPYEDKGVILNSVPNKILTYSHWSPMSGSEDVPENYHIVSYELHETDGVTTVSFTQGNSPSQEEADNMIANFWSAALQTIKGICEK